jgi:AraC-like DNA-binding protein
MMAKMFPTNRRVNAPPRRLGAFQGGGKAVKNGGGLEGVRKIERSIAYMTQHLNQPVRVAELAAHVNVSPSHYFALFKRLTGRAPIDYLIRLRVQRARALLDSTAASVKEIAVTLGYRDPLYFSRVFKSVHRAPPTEYRARQKEFKPAGTHPPAGGLLQPSGQIPESDASAARLNGAAHFQFA